MEKEKRKFPYLSVRLEIVDFERSDVIATSSPFGDSDTDGDGWTGQSKNW